MLELDLSLNSEEIYKGVKIDSFGGRKSFTVNQENLDIIGKNITEYIKISLFTNSILIQFYIILNIKYNFIINRKYFRN